MKFILFQIVIVFILLQLAVADKTSFNNDQMMGAPRDLDAATLEDPECQFAIKEIKEKFGERTAVRLLKSTSQVVAGISYRYIIEFEVGENKTEVCDVTVWAREWLTPSMEVTQMNCGIDNSQFDTEQALQAFESEMNEQTDNLFYYVIQGEATEAETDEDGGHSFSDIKFYRSTCSKQEYSEDTDACQNLSEKPVMTCSATIIRSWIESYTINEHDCSSSTEAGGSVVSVSVSSSSMTKGKAVVKAKAKATSSIKTKSRSVSKEISSSVSKGSKEKPASPSEGNSTSVSDGTSDGDGDQASSTLPLNFVYLVCVSLCAVVIRA